MAYLLHIAFRLQLDRRHAGTDKMGCARPRAVELPTCSPLFMTSESCNNLSQNQFPIFSKPLHVMQTINLQCLLYPCLTPTLLVSHQLPLPQPSRTLPTALASLPHITTSQLTTTTQMPPLQLAVLAYKRRLTSMHLLLCRLRHTAREQKPQINVLSQTHFPIYRCGCQIRAYTFPCCDVH